MDLHTPLRILRALGSPAGRAEYATAWREWRWTRVRRSSRPPIVAGLDGGLRMELNPRDDLISRALFVRRTFEPDELSFIRQVVVPGMTVLDIGANLGVHALVLAQQVGAAGAVHAFEPTPVFELLERNVRLNGLQDRVRLNRCALGEREGTLDLASCKPGYEAFTSRGAPLRPEYATGETLQVPMQTLDGYAAGRGLEKIDFVKLDVEGAECHVLRGAAGLLARRGIRRILFELNEPCLRSCGSSPEELATLVRDAGFRLSVLQESGRLAPCADLPRHAWTNLFASLEPRDPEKSPL